MVLLAEIIYEATIPLPPPTGSPKKDVVFFWGEFGGEQVLSWQSHGVALTTCELGNGTWSVPFPDRARALPREKAPQRGGRSHHILGAFLRELSRHPKLASVS